MRGCVSMSNATRNTAACAPSVAVAIGSDQNVGLPYMPNATSGPSGERRNSHDAVATENSWAASSTRIAPTLPPLTWKLQPDSTASTPMPPASWARTSSETCGWSRRLVPRPTRKAPKSERGGHTS